MEHFTNDKSNFDYAPILFSFLPSFTNRVGSDQNPSDEEPHYYSISTLLINVSDICTSRLHEQVPIDQKLILSHTVAASWSGITPCKKIDKTLMVYIFPHATEWRRIKRYIKAEQIFTFSHH